MSEDKSGKKQVKGRKKTREGTKRKQTVYESARTFEYETITYFEQIIKNADEFGVAFRRPVSQSPADVWCYSSPSGVDVFSMISNKLVLTQCKTTLDTKPPYRDKAEVSKFKEYCALLDATACWADRWKKNKNQYIRRMQKWDHLEEKWETINEDFSTIIKSKKGRHV